jgi:hypothetical protein
MAEVPIVFLTAQNLFSPAQHRWRFSLSRCVATGYPPLSRLREEAIRK